MKEHDKRNQDSKGMKPKEINQSGVGEHIGKKQKDKEKITNNKNRFERLTY